MNVCSIQDVIACCSNNTGTDNICRGKIPLSRQMYNTSRGIGGRVVLRFSIPNLPEGYRWIGDISQIFKIVNTLTGYTILTGVDLVSSRYNSLNYNMNVDKNICIPIPRYLVHPAYSIDFDDVSNIISPSIPDVYIKMYIEHQSIFQYDNYTMPNPS